MIWIPNDNHAPVAKEAKEFYFLGEIEAVGELIPVQMEMPDKDGRMKRDNAFEIMYRLMDPVA